MIVEQIIYPIEALGPGKRIGIWLVGCSRHCADCSNPELWSQDGWPELDVDSVATLVHSVFLAHTVDGITISGGEPMDQAKELAQLVEILGQFTDDILVYSGYTYEDLRCDPEKERVLQSIAVLVDGEYVAEKNTQLVLRGSSNQHIYLFRPSLEEKYKEYLSQTRTNSVQNMHFSDRSISFGIHGRDFNEALNRQLQKKGVKKKDE